MDKRQSQRIAFRVAELFLEGHSAPTIATTVNAELHPDRPLTRNQTYKYMAVARSSGYLRLFPPIEVQWARDLATIFPGISEEQIRVVDTPPDAARSRISSVTAAWVVELAKNLKKAGAAPIGLGLGPGQATLEFSSHCADILRADASTPRFKLFALAAGCPADAPQLTPMSFFNVYPPERIAGCVGLFAETLVPARDYPAVITRPGVREAFQQSDQVDIVVTAMGDMETPGRDLFTAQLLQAGVDMNTLKAQGWIGNVQYRPFTKDGPVTETGAMLRAVTLFELSQLRRLAQQKDKHVVLMVRERGTNPGMPHALLALLKEPDLRIFSELVVDLATAIKLYEMAGPKAVKPGPG